MKDIPIFICSKDRLEYLKQLLTTLLSQGYGNIYIIDTGSTYPPMLEFLSHRPFPIITIRGANHLAIWEGNVLELTGNSHRYYVYTDSDVVPDCPDDWALYLYTLLNKYPRFNKAGLGLKIDDLPDHYSRKQEVIAFEQRFWMNGLEPNVFDASIDTTIALYRAGVRNHLFDAIRTGHTYRAKHLPWYENSSNPEPDVVWYKAHMNPGIGQWR